MAVQWNGRFAVRDRPFFPFALRCTGAANFRTNSARKNCVILRDSSRPRIFLLRTNAQAAVELRQKRVKLRNCGSEFESPLGVRHLPTRLRGTLSTEFFVIPGMRLKNLVLFCPNYFAIARVMVRRLCLCHNYRSRAHARSGRKIQPSARRSR